MAPDEPAAGPSRRPPPARRDGPFAPGPPEERLDEMAARLGVPEADRPRFTALQRRNIPSKLLVFPDENHWVLKPNNSIQWYREVFGWLGTYLGK